ncbi:hypothetical protein C8R43DRAFT_1148119 [Mycena crocata]|nr:hypothetical protein C8R43DRAFT_1148119 [Mycena crocata]
MPFQDISGKIQVEMQRSKRLLPRRKMSPTRRKIVIKDLRFPKTAFKDWFQRAAETCPLSIALEWTTRTGSWETGSGEDTLALNEDFIEALELVSSRLTRVALDFNMRYVDFQLLANGPLSSIINAPNLTELHLKNPVLGFGDVTENLTSLSARLDSLPELVEIVRRFQKLRDLYISFSEGDMITDGWDEMVSACQLHTFRLQDDEIDVLRFLHMPGLHSLSVSISSRTAQTVSEFITRSSLSLKHISVSMEDDQVPEFFWRGLTTVPDVEVVFPRSYDDEALVGVLASFDLLTHLKHLTIRLYAGAFQENFRTALSARMSPHPIRTRLLDLTVNVVDPYGDNCATCVESRVAAQLGPLVLGGYDVRVLYPDQADFCPGSTTMSKKTRMVSKPLLRSGYGIPPSLAPPEPYVRLLWSILPKTWRWPLVNWVLQRNVSSARGTLRSGEQWLYVKACIMTGILPQTGVPQRDHAV